MKTKRKPLSARAWAAQRISEPFDPERDLIPEDLNHEPSHLKDLLGAGAPFPVVLYVRATTPRQLQIKRRDQDEAESQLALKRAGVQVVAVVKHRHEESYRIDGDRPGLRKAFRVARRHDAVVVTSTRCRFLRHRHFDGQHNDTEDPTPDEYRALRQLAGFVAYATIAHPSVRGKGSQTQRGQKHSARPQGRPKQAGSPMTRRRLRWLPVVRRLHDERVSLHEIARRTGLPYQTVQRWVSKRS